MNRVNATSKHRLRRIVATGTIALALAGVGVYSQLSQKPTPVPSAPPKTAVTAATGQAADALQTLPVKGRAPKTNYERSHFGDGWESVEGCDMRNRILYRDLTSTTFVSGNSCLIASGTLLDPYTGKTIAFTRGNDTSNDVQIDHVVALSNAWQTGAQQLTQQQRMQFANDPLELLAVDGPTNQAKSDGDAATWLPPNKSFRCQYIARQIAVKQKYNLWVTPAEKNAMQTVLNTCPGESLPIP